MFLFYQLALTSCSQCTGKQIVTFKNFLNTVPMSCIATVKILQTHTGKLRGPMLWSNTVCCQPWDDRYFLTFWNFTGHLLNLTQNNFYFFTISCTVGILFDIENVIKVANATKELFTIFFSWICFWLFSFPYQN